MLNINCSFLETRAYPFSKKFNKESSLYPYDKMRPFFFKITSKPFQCENVIFLDRVLDNIIS